KDATHDAPFHAGPGRDTRVPMMARTAAFGYFETGDLQALQMPYEDRGLVMLVLLPRKADGLGELEKALTAERLADWTGRLREQKVDVSLPKFKLTSAFSLADTLAELGMRKAFNPGAADFGGMNGGREPLYLSAVVHQAFVDIHEEGTEAA